MPLPIRETAVIAVTTFAIILDYYRDIAIPSSPILSQGVDRPLLFFVVPLATLLLLGERPSDYGLRIGNWRLGLPVMLAAMLILAPVINSPATFGEEFGWRAYLQAEYGIELE